MSAPPSTKGQPTGSGSFNDDRPDFITVKEFRKSIKVNHFDDEEEIGSDNGDFSSVDGGQKGRARTSEIKIAQFESRAVRGVKKVLFFIMAIAAIILSVTTYFSVYEGECEYFEAMFLDHAMKVAEAFETNAARRLGAIESFTTAITSYALATGDVWPYVTIPDFERRASYVLDLADVVSLFLVPLVTDKTRAGWEAYSVKHQSWLMEGLLVEYNYTSDAHARASIALRDEINFLNSTARIPEKMTRLEGFEMVYEPGPGPYAPLWQFTPALPYGEMVNYNTLSHPTRTHVLKAIMNSSRTLVSRAWDVSDNEDPETLGRKDLLNSFLSRWHEGGKSYQEGPISDLYVPVFDGFGGNQGQLVAVLTAYVYWQIYFENVLPENANGTIAVLENSCNQSYTYAINGQTARFIGQGDLHDPKYDYLEFKTLFGIFLQQQNTQVDDMVEGPCLYRLRIFPSQEMEQLYLSNEAIVRAIVFFSVFIITSLVFLLYDYLVERRQKIVLQQAVRSTEVVQSLFPSTVRDRLPAYKNNADVSNSNSKMPKMHSERSDKDKFLSTMFEESSAIADLYEECTVLFADLVGFTKWSSEREPTQVFQLLETIYGSFDKIAHRRHVFKIETIGDCYLAVTGLPNPQRDHAVIMARFAAECNAKMNQIGHKLVDALGPETADLTLRIGMHSGKVTAGVLRGDRARFQIFGDTVNTAARMESTGKPGKIQASQTTADLLIGAGKIDWVVLREEEVEAKGKGLLQTYWLQPKVDISSTASVTERTITSRNNSLGLG